MTEKILLDTDIGSDCDDAGAIAILHNFSKEGKAEILGITHCGSEIGGAITIKAINEWYGREDILVGKYTQGVFLEGEFYRKFSDKIMKHYLEKNEMPYLPDSVKTMRRVLSENKDVTVVTIGMLNNVANLLKSEPDEISEESGFELVRDRVRCIYSMGGNFEDSEYAEFNIRMDTTSANYVASRCPVPVIYAGFELGKDIKTGTFLDTAKDEHPVKQIYEIFGGRGFNWDPITVYCAINQENKLFKKISGKQITFDDEGKTVCKDGGKDGYLVMEAEPELIRMELDKYLR